MAHPNLISGVRMCKQARPQGEEFIACSLKVEQGIYHSSDHREDEEAQAGSTNG
jgi:hypothetical protein